MSKRTNLRTAPAVRRRSVLMATAAAVALVGLPIGPAWADQDVASPNGGSAAVGGPERSRGEDLARGPQGSARIPRRESVARVPYTAPTPLPAVARDALPRDPNVVAGGATFAEDGSRLDVTQSTDRVVIDWRSFDIGQGSEVNFFQPGTTSIAVNRISEGGLPSQIQGILRANGTVVILNPNGVIFSATSRVDVGGLVASTGRTDVGQFMAGSNRLEFTGATSGEILMGGSINIADAGLAAFVAPHVRNDGVINARLGRVALASGETFTLDLAGDRLIELGLGSSSPLVENFGSILVDGGRVQLSAVAAGAVVDQVINAGGLISVASARAEGGTIVLEGANGGVTVSGELNASGATGGGDITLGGANIQTTAGSLLRADAVDAGDGGSIVAIADGKGSYAGALSARGGANGGDGGFIETSGKTVSLDAGLRVDTTAVNGVNGSWSIDPEDLVIGAGEAAAVVASLSTTNVVLQAQNSITIDSLINSSAQSNANTLSLNDEGGVAGLTVNLNAAIRLGVNQRLLGQATQVNVRNGGVIQNAVDVALANAGILISAGDYVGGTIINKNGLTLTGEAGARIVMPETPELNGVTIAADNVTVQGLEIVGPASAQSYLTYGWSGITRGIFAMNGADNFTIANNNIHGVRTGILVDGRNAGGSITGNIIDNTKSGISVQYTDAGLLNAEGFAVNIAGNSQGPFGNEWGFNFHLNGHQTPGGLVGNAVKIAPTASMAVQQALLAVSAANGGMSAQDQGYNFSNRTSVNVGVGGNDANQGSALGQLATIQAGINAVVTGGRVNVGAGTFVQPTGSPAYLWVNKSVEIAGAGQGLTIIDARGASTYGIRVQADNVNLHDFTLWGVAAAGNTYGIKVEPLQTGPSDPNARLFNFALSNVTIQGSGKTELDLNGVIGATIANVTANGMAVGGSTITAGNGISITDSANITLTGVTTLNNGWGGLALYQTNRTFNQQVDNISVDASNTFNEANGIYLEDQSDGGGLSVVGGVGLDYGALSIAGYDYIVNDRSNPADIYTWFQRDQASAFNWLGLTGRAATGSIEGWNGSGGNNVFSVGVIGGTAMSINSAIRAARSGAIINVGAGTYGQALDIDKSLSILGAGAGLTIIQPTALLATGVGHKYDANMNVSVFVHGASNVILDGLTIDGNNLAGNAGVFWSNASGELRNSHITNVRPFSGLQTGHGLAVDATAGNTTNLLVSNVLFDNWNKNAIDAVTGQGATNNGGTINLTIQGSTFTGRGATGTIAQNGVVLWERGGGVVNGTINNSTFSNIEYTGSNATASGLLVYGSPNGQTSVHGTSFSGVQTYLALDGGTLNELNATGNVFDGVAADTATLAQLFAIEDRISHGVDLAGAGLIRIKAGQVFVTTGAGSGAINRGLALASTGNTVNVAAGTYADTVQISRGVTLAGAGIGQTNLTGGILMSGSFSDLTLRGFTVTGNAGGNFVVQGGQITNLTVDGVRIDAQNVTGRHGFGSGQYGGAISITNSQFANIDGWVVFDTRSGAGAGGGTQIASGVFSNNIIDNSNGSIAFRQQTGAFAYPNIVIANNTVTNVGNSTNSFGGVFKVFNGNTVDFTGNSVSDVGTSGFNPAGEAAYGAVLITRDVQQLNIIGNTFTNNNQVLAIEPGRGLSTNTFLAGNTFTNNRYGIYMPNNALAGGAVTFGAGNNFIAGANTLQHIVWRSAAGLDLTGVAFNGKLGSAMSLAELFDVEDLISHGTDVAGRGLARVKAGQVFVTTGSASVQRGVNVASTGDTVHVEAGTYTLPGELSITRSVSLVGAGVGGTIFNSQSAGYGIFAAADNVTLSGFTFNGNPTGSYGIKVQPNSGAAGARVHDFAITNVAINGTRRTGLDLNGVVGAVIDGVTVTGSIAGNGISITDSADVTVRNTTTSGNAWGGLALYQANRFYNQQVSDIVVEASNVFGEVRGLYTQDESALFGFGSLTLLGFDFTVRNDVFQADAAGYTFYKATLQDALNYGVALGAAGSYVQGWDGSQGDNHFYVGAGNAGAGQQFLSIQTAFDKSSTGSLIDIASGAYGGVATLAGQRDLRFGVVELGGLNLTSGAAGTIISGDVTATGGLDFDGAIVLGGDTRLAAAGDISLIGVDGQHALAVEGQGQVYVGQAGASVALASLSVLGSDIVLRGATTTGGQSFAGDTVLLWGGFDAGGNVIVSGPATLGGDTVIDSDGDIQLGSVDGEYNLSLNATGAVDVGAIGAAEALNGLNVLGAAITSHGATTQAAQSWNATTVGLSGAYAAGGDITVNGAANLNGSTSLTSDDYVALGSVDGAHDLTVEAANSVSVGQIGGTTALVDLVIEAGQITAAGARTTGSQMFSGARVGLSGAFIAGGDFTVDGDTDLNGDVVIDGDDVTLASVDGGHDLSVEADGAVSLGALGSTTALASLDVSGVSISSNGAATTGDQSFRAASIGLSGGYMVGGDFTADGATNLTGDVAIDGDDVTLASVDGAHDLSVDADGAVSLGAAGSTTALASLDVSGASIASNGAATTGSQTFQAASIGLSGGYMAGGDFTADGATNL
ncbi:two-partner secretion domain-containing protein, partial [Brevundimonas sp.]|uniref:two-partner secretion domain-containing protein n=1 Tax=Brevundimonas sp. TaxID=1871086 RepID=UPI002FCC6417